MHVQHFPNGLIFLLPFALLACASCKSDETVEEVRPELTADATEPKQVASGPSNVPQQEGVPSTPPVVVTDAKRSSPEYSSASTLSSRQKTAVSSAKRAPVQHGFPANASPSEAAATFNAAQIARTAAQAAAREGNLAAAYSQSLSAWESLQEFGDHPNCRGLAAELLKELESYGERLTVRQSGLPPNTLDKPVRFE